MGIRTRIVMIMLPLILCIMQLSHSMDLENCTRTTQQTVKDLMGLTKRLFDEQTNLDENILPTKLRQQNYSIENKMQRHKRLDVVTNLLSLITQRKSLKEMEDDSKLVTVLRVIFESLYNETCKFVYSENGIDCSNVSETKRVLLLLKLREQAINNLEILKEMTPRTKFERNNDETYVTWRKIVEPDVDKNEGTLGIFGIFLDYNKTCINCEFDHCPKPHNY